MKRRRDLIGYLCIVGLLVPLLFFCDVRLNDVRRKVSNAEFTIRVALDEEHPESQDSDRRSELANGSSPEDRTTSSAPDHRIYRITKDLKTSHAELADAERSIRTISHILMGIMPFIGLVFGFLLRELLIQKKESSPESQPSESP